MLIAHGAVVNWEDGVGRTSLSLAAACSRWRVAKLLLRAGADAVTAVVALTNVLEGLLAEAVQATSYLQFAVSPL